MAEQNNGEYKNVKVVPVTTFLTKFTDGNGQEETRLGFVLGPDVRFLDLKALSKPAQSWLRDELLVALGLKEVEAPAPAEASLERQV
jgi:hypothetical protein